MRHARLATLVVGIATTFGFGWTVPVNAQPPHTRGAALFLRTDRSQYSLRDTIVIEVGVRNDGQQPLYVHNRMAWGMGGGLVLWLRDDHGEAIDKVLRDDTMLPPPPEEDLSLFAKVLPGMFLGTRRAMEARNLVRKAGRYTIQVEYRSSLSREFVPPNLRALPALWMESPSIWSEKVRLDITD
ncbi:MAG: hypothetical protein ABIT71_19630 [Vicinamibacteraceae bacterium]